MTKGIKLSNISLRDSEKNWHSLKDAYIGDMLGKNVNEVQLGPFLQSLDNSTGSGNVEGLYLDISNDRKLRLMYDEDNPSVHNPGVDRVLHSVDIPGVIDTNTEYDLAREDRNDGKFLVFTNTTNNTSKEVPLPLGNKSGFEATGGQGFFPEISGSGTVLGYTASFPIRLVEKDFSLATLSSSVSSIDKNLNFGDSFTVITSINTDNYGRVTQINKTKFKMPDFEDILNTENARARIAEIANQEIEKVLEVQ